MVDAKIFKFNDGNWNDGIWGSEDYSDTVKLIYVGKVVFVVNTGTSATTVILPFPVYGTQSMLIDAGATIIKIRKEQ